MIKKCKRRKKVQNQGNTYIMVVATLSFLAVLVAAMLVAVALCYRMKAYDINARDNFYYLEQAMDEIYAGVGADAMKHLNTAYDDTIEVLVYFDAETQSYITMKNDRANVIMKNTYMKLIKDDPNYDNSTTVQTHLKAFLSNPYSTTNTEGVILSVGNVDIGSDDEVVIKDLILKREAKYSTFNTKKAKDDPTIAGDIFVQTITTDLVIGKPEFDVNFNTIDSDLNEVYKYTFVADKGIEIGNSTSVVNITGNIYAAADFYNKDYNITDSNEANYITKTTDEDKIKYAAVSNYEKGQTRTMTCNGVYQKSMYSGIYIDGADVMIFADRMVIPGSISAFNSASVTISGLTDDLLNTTEIWADGIVLGGYSLISNVETKDVTGSTLKMRANAYISDDLELNAKASQFEMVGEYYGYNYASLDNRTYTDECVDANGGRSYVSSVTSQGVRDGATIEGQAHYNSSAIIVNGAESSLDLSGVSSMYIAGQAYIETSKKTNKQKITLDENGDEQAYTVSNQNGELQVYERDEYVYPTYDYADGKNASNTKVNADGSVSVDDVKDNYTVQASKDANGNVTKSATTIQDYRTGEAISIKSNQLAYIPNWAVKETPDGLYLSVPVSLRDSSLLNAFWDDGDQAEKLISQIPIVKSVISGKTYYFFDFDSESARDKLSNGEVASMNQFIAAYAALFEVDPISGSSEGTESGFVDITEYEHFEVEMLKVNALYDPDTEAPITNSTGDFDKIYSNSAITVKNGASFTIKANSSSLTPLVTAAKNINANIKKQNSYREENETKRGEINTNETNALVFSTGLTSELQSQYKEVKWTLTPSSSNQKAVNDAHDMEESDITPINYFFNFNMLGDNWSDAKVKLSSGYQIWVCEGDVEVDASEFSDGNVKGMVICKGDVTFDDDVKSFEGLIVSGSKVKIEHSVNFTANEEIVKTILRECDASQNESGAKNYYRVCELFQHYQSIYKVDGSGTEIETESMKSISAVQFEDVLSFDNWKKNVD